MKKQTSIELHDVLHRWLIVPLIMGSIIGVAEAIFIMLYDFIWKTISPYLTFPYIFVILPTGLLSSYLVMRFIGGSLPGSSTHAVLRRFHFEDGAGKPREFLASPISSALTMGFGGSAGVEGPSLSIGGSIAYTLSRLLRIKRSDVRIVFLAGAGAALGAVLKAPLTGILFAIEVPYTQDIEHNVFLPAIPMGVVAYGVYVAIVGQAPIFTQIQGVTFPTPLEMGLSVIEGLFLGGIALAFIYVYKYTEKIRVRGNRWDYAAVLLAGLLLAAMGCVMPMSLGVGYGVISSSMIFNAGLWRYGIAFILVLVVAKMLTTSITLNEGGSGGLFVPSVFLGAVASVGLMKVLDIPFSPILVAAGAAAMVAATNKTLLAAVAFVAETMSPYAIIPALLAGATAYILTSNKGLYENQLQFSPARTHVALMRLGNRVDREVRLDVGEIMRPARFKLSQNDSVAHAILLFSLSGDTALPVVGTRGEYLGRVELESLLASNAATVEDLIAMDKPLVVDESASTAVKRILSSGKGILFAVDGEGRLKGVVRTADLIRHYAKILYGIMSSQVPETETHNNEN
ncbi:MAG: chloride channel protein [Thermoprotei archaeon]